MNSNNLSYSQCWQCLTALPDDYEHPTCCDGYMCGCMGLPTEPPFCSQECGNTWWAIRNESITPAGSSS